MKILEIIIKQFLIIYTGGLILYVYYRFRGDNITFSNIINQNDDSTGIKKYRYKAFFLGVVFYVALVILIALLFQ